MKNQKIILKYWKVFYLNNIKNSIFYIIESSCLSLFTLVSGWSGLNRRPPVPKTGALPLRHTPFIHYSSNFDDILSKKSSKSSDIGEFSSVFSSDKSLPGFEKLES